MSSLHTSTHPVPHAHGARRWLVLAIVSVALLLIVIDMTVLYTALPRLTHDLAATASAKLWIVNAYALVVSGLLLGMGTLGDRLGHKQLFLAGLVVFGAASLAAAFAPSANVLIAARGFLGVGAAMMMPATLSLIRLTFTDAHEQAFAIGIWASVASGGAAFGPIVGGALLEHFWWGSVFLINVPIVLIALPIAAWLIPNSGATSKQPWDWVGSLLFMVGLIGVTYAIKSAGKVSPDWMTVGVAVVVGAVFLWAFVARQRRSAHPLLDFSLFRNPVFAGAVVAALMAAASLIGMQLVFSQRLQLVMGYSPLEAGLAGMPLSLAAWEARVCCRSR
jgi:DHA2 family multidrug resistance protein-like MFS transporter